MRVDIEAVKTKLRKARGRKPKFKRHRNESFSNFIFRVMSKEPKLNKAISNLINPKPINFPLFVLVEGLRDEQKKNIEQRSFSILERRPA
jgi:hypothetical protein